MQAIDTMNADEGSLNVANMWTTSLNGELIFGANFEISFLNEDLSRETGSSIGSGVHISLLVRADDEQGLACLLEKSLVNAVRALERAAEIARTKTAAQLLYSAEPTPLQTA